ncbi:MAG: glycosyltransferase [Patescibacteria group bacterium]|jgi:cellulose synthase/poly-beta-1,6-N-acetylglucosamine synthase-like glycosyltransferase
MKKKETAFSVIIPVRTITPYVKETLKYLEQQTFKGFETIIVTDKQEKVAGARVIASGEPTPAFKRNLGAKEARGEILAFLDDDSYPTNEWLEQAKSIFEEADSIAGVCGPTLTPPKDNIYQKASGWVWASPLGSGGAGVFRNRVKPRREVDDFPSVNLLVRKDCFERAQGFDIRHWPGEDTKLCLDLVKLGKKIIYDPRVLVFHHRRPVLLPHLKQISRYALRRGYFAKKFPKTSFRLGYFMPSVSVYGLLLGLAFMLTIPPLAYFYLLLAGLYLLLLFLSSLEVLIVEKNLFLAFLVAVSIAATHIVYGLLFPLGFLQKELKTTPRKIDEKTKVYLGG